MNKLLIPLIAAFLLTGCVGSNSPANTSVDTSYYVIDLKNYFFCKGMSDVCQDMTVIITNTQHATAIEEAYAQKITGPNYRANLAKMILSPGDNSYTSKKLTENGRYRKVPVNQMTDTVWRTLTKLAYRNQKSY